MHSVGIVSPYCKVRWRLFLIDIDTSLWILGYVEVFQNGGNKVENTDSLLIQYLHRDPKMKFSLIQWYQRYIGILVLRMLVITLYRLCAPEKWLCPTLMNW